MKKEYYLGLKICGVYAVHIIEGNIEDKVMVHEDDIDGFVQCLNYLGYRGV